MAKALDKPSPYERDYVAWLEEQAAHLRAGRLHALDVENIAEEPEGLARSDRHQLANRLETLLLDLLTWQHQPSRRPRSWQSTIVEQRIRIHRLLKESPSLRPDHAEVAAEIYPDAVRRAIVETGLSARRFPEALPYTLEDVLEREPWAEAQRRRNHKASSQADEGNRNP